MGLFDGIKARPILKQIKDNEAKLKNDEAFLENLISLNQGGVRNLDIFEKAKYLRQFNKDILEKRKQYIKLAYKPGYDQKQAILEAESEFVVKDYKYTKAIKDAGYKCEIGREIDYAGLMRDRILASDGNQYEALLGYIPSEIENYQELCVEIVSQKPNLLTLIKNPTPAMFEAAKNSRNSRAVNYAADHIPEFKEYLEKSKSTVIVENSELTGAHAAAQQAEEEARKKKAESEAKEREIKENGVQENILTTEDKEFIAEQTGKYKSVLEQYKAHVETYESVVENLKNLSNELTVAINSSNPEKYNEIQNKIKEERGRVAVKTFSLEFANIRRSVNSRAESENKPQIKECLIEFETQKKIIDQRHSICTSKETFINTQNYIMANKYELFRLKKPEYKRFKGGIGYEREATERIRSGEKDLTSIQNALMQELTDRGLSSADARAMIGEFSIGERSFDRLFDIEIQNGAFSKLDGGKIVIPKQKTSDNAPQSPIIYGGKQYGSIEEAEAAIAAAKKDEPVVENNGIDTVAVDDAEAARKSAEEAAKIKAEAEAAAKREAEARAAEEAAAKKAEWLKNKEAFFTAQKEGFEKHLKNFYKHDNPLLAMPELNNTINQLQTYLPQIKNAVASNNQEEINRILGEIQSKTPGIVKDELESLLSGDGRYFSPEATLKGLQGEMLACQRAISNIEKSIYFDPKNPDPVLQEMKARLEKMKTDYSEAYKNMQGVKELISDIRKKVAEARIAAKSAGATVKKEEPVVENNGSGTAGVDEVEAKRQAEEAAARKAAEEAARIKAETAPTQTVVSSAPKPESAPTQTVVSSAPKPAPAPVTPAKTASVAPVESAAKTATETVAPVSTSSKIIITAEEMRTIEEEARNEVLAEMGPKANKRNKQKVVNMKIARLVEQKRRKLMGQKAQGKTESAPVEKDVEEPKIEPVVPVQVSEKAARKAAAKAAAIEKANEEARIARENFEREMAEKRAAAEKDAPAVSESTQVETVSADRPVSVAATTTPKPSEPIQRDGLTEFLVPYAKKYADYYSGEKGTRGHARDKEEQSAHRKLTYQMKKLITKRIEEVSMGDDGTVNQEIMQTLSQPVDMLDFEELVADERATLKLFEIAASGVYEDGGQRVRLTRKQRVALAGVLVKVADRKLEIENKKAQEAATKKMGQGLEAEGVEKI